MIEIKLTEMQTIQLLSLLRKEIINGNANIPIEDVYFKLRNNARKQVNSRDNKKLVTTNKLKLRELIAEYICRNK